MPRLSPVIAGPSSSRPTATASTSAPVKRTRKRSRHSLPYEGDDEEGNHQRASSSSWTADDNSGSHDFQAWPRYNQEDDRPRSSSYRSTSSTRHKPGHARDDESLYDVVARIATSVIEERQQQQQQQQQRRRRGERRRVISAEGDGVRRSRSNSGGSDDNSSDSEASSSSQRSGNGKDDAAQDTESDDDVDDDDDDEQKAFAIASTSTSDPISALIDPLVLSIQSGLETLLASLERRRQRKQESRGSIGSKRRASVMTGEDVLEALQALVDHQRGTMRGLGGGRAEAVGGMEVLEAVRERVERRRRELQGSVGEEQETSGGERDSDRVQQEKAQGHGSHEEEDGGEGAQDFAALDGSQSRQQPPQHSLHDSVAPPPRRRPPSSKQPAQAATWFGDESARSRKRRLDALLLLG